MKKLFSIFLFIQSLSVIAQSPNIDIIDDAVVLVKIYDYKGGYVGHGSGFILDSTGTVVTNYHVVKDAFSLKITMDVNGIKVDYDVEKILTGSEYKDLATLKIKTNSTTNKFPFVKLARALPVKGSDCWAIGTPADPIYMNTVSKGVVSNIVSSSSPIIIQTNAEITHGSSGGALINNNGEVIGITSSGDGSEDGARASINFAIYVGELKNLQTINKKTLVDESSIPSEISFYTTFKYSASIRLYVDNIYIGSFTQYFQNEIKPKCGQEGTITRLLYPGEHTYSIFYTNENKWLNGTITLTPGNCQLFKVGSYQSPAQKVLLNDENKSELIKEKNSGKSSITNLSTNSTETVKLIIFTKKNKTYKVSAPGIGYCGMCSKKAPLTLIVDKNTSYKLVFEAGRNIQWINLRIGSADKYHQL